VFLAGTRPAYGQGVQLADEQLIGLQRAGELLQFFERVPEHFIWPVQGRLSSAFGWRNVSVDGNRQHGGIDLAAPVGTPVHASRPGTVTVSGWVGAYGYAVYLDHGDGMETRYAHLSTVNVQHGQTVRQGDVLGEVGSTGASTGPHLHFEIRSAGVALDPLPLLETGSGTQEAQTAR
jgi:murein DD-endopeptidase MepM/ murein hydrolase activator NlpD